MKNYLLFIITFFSILCTYSQTEVSTNKSIDSIDVLLNLARKQIFQTNFEDAFNYSIQAVNLSHSSNNKSKKGEAYTCVANSYQIILDQTNSEKYFKEALKLGKETNNLYVITSATNGLGNVYSKNPETLDKAIDYYEESAKYSLKSKNPERVFITSLNTASLFLDYNRPFKAHKYIEIAKENFKKYDSPPPLYEVTLNYVIGIYYKQKNENSKAVAYLDKAQKTSEDNKLYYDLIDIHNAKSEIYQKDRKFSLAIKHIKKEQSYKDLNYDAEKSEQIEKAKAGFKVKEVERELEIASRESASNKKIIIATVLGIISLLSVIFLMIYSNAKRKSNYILQANNEMLLEAKTNAERLTKLKSEFITRVSHELRTPLYGVVGITSMLQEDKEVTSKHGDLINSLKFSGDHLINLVNNVLKISKIESQEIKLHNTNTNLQVLLNNIVTSFKFHAKDKGINLNIKYSKKLANTYSIDAVRLSEILINLIDNAIKFTNKGNVDVHVSVVKQNNKKDKILFEIKDTGTGILEEDQLAIFENFKQSIEEENTCKGAGLGLPIVKHLLHLMGSCIELKSTINKGSTFSFAIDIAKVSNIQNIFRILPPANAIRILVVEDNKISQMVTGNLLKLIGHQCTIVENGLEALEIVNKEVYDLVLMDLNMPVMNGYDCTKEIKLQYPDLKIIALTANEISEVHNKCLAVGMDEVINKPLTKNELDQVIHSYISA